jgi:hypothetical protein
MRKLTTKEELLSILPAQIDRANKLISESMSIIINKWVQHHNHPNWHLGLPEWYVRFVLKYFRKWILTNRR